MSRKMMLPSLLLAFFVPFAVGANAPNGPAGISGPQIADKGIEAIGGASAWRGVTTMSYAGKMDAGGKQDVQLPFLIEMKRPRKTRVEIDFEKDKAIQVYDGQKGWKLRPFLNRRDVEPFTADELRAASMEPDLDGMLVDYSAKGEKVELEGIDKVEGHDAYKLKLTTRDGHVRHLWIDEQSYLTVKVEGTPRRMDGTMRIVEVYLRDYRTTSGLKIPYVLETTVQGVKKSHKMTIEKVQVNPKLDDALFQPPKSK